MPEIISNPATEKKKKKKDKKSIADIQVYVLITTHHFPFVVSSSALPVWIRQVWRLQSWQARLS